MALRPCWKKNSTVVSPPLQFDFRSNCLLLQHKVQRRRSELTIALLYYNDHVYLRMHIRQWVKLSTKLQKALTFLIVDDGSLTYPAAELIRQEQVGSLDIVLFRIEADIPWNIGGARNLASTVVPTKYYLLLDTDIKVPSALYFNLLELVAAAEQHYASTNIETVYVQFQRRQPSSQHFTLKPHPAVALLSKRAYWLAGGCDEDFVRFYGQTDPHFMWKLARTNAVRSIPVHQSYPDYPLLEQLSKDNEIRYERDARRNTVLFENKKLTGNWSCTYLRFSWSLVLGSL